MPEVIKSGLPLRDGSGDYVKNEKGDGTNSTRNTYVFLWKEMQAWNLHYLNR